MPQRKSSQNPRKEGEMFSKLRNNPQQPSQASVAGVAVAPTSSAAEPAKGDIPVTANSMTPMKLFRVFLIIAVLTGFIAYITGAYIVFIEISTLISTSPKGSLSTPKGIIALCRTVQKTIGGDQVPQTSVALLIIYLLLQTFCIPGTIVLNAIAGAVLGVKLGLPLCIAAGTVGASCCYLFSSVLGARLAEKVDGRLMNGRGIPRLRGQVNKYRNELFTYLLFLRLTPILPNWLINLASPVVNVPLKSFALATFFGIAPQTYLSVRFGTLVNAESVGAIVTPWDTLTIAVIGLLVLFVGRLKKRFAQEDGPATAATASASGSTGAGLLGASGVKKDGGSPVQDFSSTPFPNKKKTKVIEI